MDSIVAYTEEIDDMDQAASEIFEQVKNFTFHRQTIGIVFVDEETDYSGLYRKLSEKWKFPIVGCTAMAMLVTDGFRNLGISVMLLSADDCDFAVGITDDFYIDNYKEALEHTYRETLAKLPDKPKLIITYGSMVTENEHVDADFVLKILDEISDHVPICGAVASDGFSFSGYKVFLNDHIGCHCQAMVMISGNIDPKFYTVNSIKNKSTSTYKVTEAKRNIVYRLNQSTFIDVLRQENMMVSKKIVMGDYILSPFVITLEYPNGDIVEGARTLSYLDHESGAGAFLGDLPEGAILSIGIINRSDVQTSVEAGFDKVVEELKRNEGKYKTILCSTCCARFIALGSNPAAEAEAYLGRLPPGVSLMGIYSYGEYGPVYGSKTHNHYNLFHNFTFSIILL